MLAIIGGTGLYSLDGLEVISKVQEETPFGKPSSEILLCKYKGKDIAFMARHGSSHSLLPHEINYRANIYALKMLGVKQIIGVSAIGSLQKELAPGDFVIPNQYIDYIKGSREKTFFGDGVAAHISTAESVCPELSHAVMAKAVELGIKIHANKTYVCVDGPRLGTKAESHFFRDSMQSDVIGMTNVPEVFLAREAQICYCTIGIVTDYDCWLEDPNEHANVSDIMARYGQSIDSVKALLNAVLSDELPRANDSYRQILGGAVLTPDAAMTQDKLQMLDVLRS